MRPRDLYYRIDPGREDYICTVCSKIIKGAGNACVHVKKHKKEEDLKNFMNPSQFFHTTTSGKKVPINPNTVDIIRWRCKKAVSFRAIDDDDFRTIAKYPEAVCDRKTMASFQKEISAQILQKSVERLHDHVISICIDGGTVLHTKWIAVASLSNSGSNIRFQLLDIISIDISCTIENIIQKVTELKEKLAKQNAIICAACTDNASNFAGCFNNSIKNSEHFIKDIVRVSCACHTGQLMLADLYEQDDIYCQIVNSLSEFSIGLCHKTLSAIQAKGLTGYPPVQKQRWNSYHDCLVYVNRNFDKLAELFPNSIIFKNADIAEEIEETIRPIHVFTTDLEGDDNDQSDVFVQCRILQSKLEILSTRNEHAKKLLDIFHTRCCKTLDMKLSETIYFFSSQGLNEFADVYKYYPETPGCNAEADEKNSMRLEKFMEIKPKIDFLCEAWGMKHTVIANLFLTITKSQHKFEEKYPTTSELLDILSECSMKNYLEFDRFIQRIRILPASEASAERIFAGMRDQIDEKMHRMKPETLKSTLVINYEESKNRILGK